jgi:hypothetical protein
VEKIQEKKNNNEKKTQWNTKTQLYGVLLKGSIKEILEGKIEFEFYPLSLEDLYTSH